MKEKIKVAFIGYNLTCGGAERNIINLAHFLQKKGIQTDIILFKQIIEYEEEYKDILKKLTIIPLLNTRNKIPKFLIPIRFMETLAKLFYVIRKNRYQILIGALEYHPFYFASFFAKLFKIKNILVFHEGIRESSFIVRFVINLLLRVAFVLADKIVCVSEGVGYSLQMVYGVPKEKIIVIYNGVDIGRINQKAEELISPEDNSLLKSQNLIITLGRLVEKKGQIHLIESFKKTQVSWLLLVRETWELS